jgi:hypothetical protein
MDIDFNPGPGLVTLVTLVMSALLAIFLLKITENTIYPTQGEIHLPLSKTLVDELTAPVDEQATVEDTPADAACAVSRLFPQSVSQWCGLITRYANRHDLPADLVASVIWLESGGNPQAYSRSGAVGLMQIMPRDGIAASFQCINGPCFADRPSIAELQDPEFNVAFGTRMLAGLFRRYGNWRDALKSYGPMNVGYYYADKVLNLFERHRKQ